MTDTDVTFLSCYNIVDHTRMHVMTLTSPSTLPLSRPWAGLSMRHCDDFTQSHLLIQGSSLLRMHGASSFGVGDDRHSWAVDGARQLKWQNGKEPYECTWQAGDVIGLACDLEAMRVHVSVNGSFAAPKGVVFELAPKAVRDGLFAAITGKTCKVRCNLGEAAFKHAPPSADFTAFVHFQ